MFTEYEPGSYISFVSPTPLLLVVALGDHLTVVDEALAAYQRALEPKKLVTLSGGSLRRQCERFRAGFDTGARLVRDPSQEPLGQLSLALACFSRCVIFLRAGLWRATTAVLDAPAKRGAPARMTSAM